MTISAERTRPTYQSSPCIEFAIPAVDPTFRQRVRTWWPQSFSSSLRQRSNRPTFTAVQLRFNSPHPVPLQSQAKKPLPSPSTGMRSRSARPHRTGKPSGPSLYHTAGWPKARSSARIQAGTRYEMDGVSSCATSIRTLTPGTSCLKTSWFLLVASGMNFAELLAMFPLQLKTDESKFCHGRSTLSARLSDRAQVGNCCSKA